MFYFRSCSTRFVQSISLAVACACMSAQSRAQSVRLANEQISQIVDASLQAVIPPEMVLGPFTVAERGIRFDYDVTMIAFGHGKTATGNARFQLQSRVSAGAPALLNECDQMGTKPCAALGNSVYATVEPISVSGSVAVVWLHVVYATTMQSGRTFRSSSSSQIHLERSRSGVWKFVRVSMTRVS